MKKKVLLMFVLCATVCAQVVFSQKYEVEPIEDAHSFVVTGKEGFGYEETLELKYNTYAEWRKDAVMKFDISKSTVKAPYQKAILKLYISDNGVATTIRVLKIQRSNANYGWTEATISGSAWPGVSWNNDMLADVALEGELDQMYYDFDITEWVNAEKAENCTTVNLNIRVISGNTQENSVFINSRENLEGNHPLLVLEGENMDSATESIGMQGKGFFVKDRQLFLEGYDSPQQYEIVSLSGIVLKRGIVAGSELVDALEGLVIVRVGGEARIVRI